MPLPKYNRNYNNGGAYGRQQQANAAYGQQPQQAEYGQQQATADYGYQQQGGYDQQQQATAAYGQPQQAPAEYGQYQQGDYGNQQQGEYGHQQQGEYGYQPQATDAYGQQQQGEYGQYQQQGEYGQPQQAQAYGQQPATAAYDQQQGDYGRHQSNAAYDQGRGHRQDDGARHTDKGHSHGHHQDYGYNHEPEFDHHRPVKKSHPTSHHHHRSTGAAAVNMAKVVLMLINMVFLVAGGLFIYFACNIKSSGWKDVFEGDYAYVGTAAYLATLGVGIVIIILASIGCFGAVLGNRKLLTTYAGVLITSGLLFVGIAIGAGMGKSTAKTWHDKSYPAVTQEQSIAAGFNRIYCLAQVGYYCSEAKAVEITTIFQLSSLPTSALGAMTVTEACAKQQISSLDAMTALCTLCKQVSTYASYDPFSNWADKSCPRTTANQAWCGAMLLNKGTADDGASAAPYSPCRKTFLELLIKWTNTLMTGSIIVGVLIAAVLGFTLIVRSGSRAPPLEESFIVDTPSP